jgi:hypothetical protein
MPYTANRPQYRGGERAVQPNPVFLNEGSRTYSWVLKQCDQPCRCPFRLLHLSLREVSLTLLFAWSSKIDCLGLTVLLFIVISFGRLILRKCLPPTRKTRCSIEEHQPMDLTIFASKEYVIMKLLCSQEVTLTLHASCRGATHGKI